MLYYIKKKNNLRFSMPAPRPPGVRHAEVIKTFGTSPNKPVRGSPLVLIIWNPGYLIFGRLRPRSARMRSLRFGQPQARPCSPGVRIQATVTCNAICKS
jgi:hypothetical protein